MSVDESMGYVPPDAEKWTASTIADQSSEKSTGQSAPITEQNEASPASKFQYIAGFEEFTGAQLDATGEYQPLTEEQSKKINNRLDRLGEFFDGADIP